VAGTLPDIYQLQEMSGGSYQARIQQNVLDLETALFMNATVSNPANHTLSPIVIKGKISWIELPKTVGQTVNILISELPLKDKAIFANMNFEDLSSLLLSLGEFIRNIFGLCVGNTELLESCRSICGEKTINPDHASMVIIIETWKKLQETHKIKAVK
jgi:hypothetical protein